MFHHENKQEEIIMDRAMSIRRYLEQRGSGSEKNTKTLDGLPNRLLEKLVMKDLSIDHVESGVVLCSIKVPSRLLNSGNSLHGGAIVTMVDLLGSAAIIAYEGPTTGVSVEISVSYLDAAYVDEEIEIEAKPLRVGKAIAVASVELRKKKTGKIIAQGRHTKYLPVTSKM